MQPGDNPLTNLRPQVVAHWEKYRPKMTARLKQAGLFDQAVDAAVALTTEAVLTYRAPAGGNEAQAFWQAWEVYREEWAFLPSEEALEELPLDPSLWTLPPEAGA
jgi:hypothetical protein